MVRLKLARLEMQIMEIFWNHGACCVREIQEAFPERGRPAYTTVQTTVNRLERILRTSLSDSEVQQARAIGAQLSEDRVIALALNQ